LIHSGKFQRLNEKTGERKRIREGDRERELEEMYNKDVPK
jgi:hypothetical protein